MALTKKDIQSIGLGISAAAQNEAIRSRITKEAYRTVAENIASVMALRYDNFNVKYFLENIDFEGESDGDDTSFLETDNDSES